MEELEICRKERDILNKKLHVHLDRWTLDKIVFQETAAKDADDCRILKAEQAYEIARSELCIGSLRQQVLLLKCKLESAVEDTELKEIQVSALRAQLAEERKWLDSANRKLQSVDARFSAKVASETRKRTKEIERRMHHLQNVADEETRDHKAELERVETKYVLLVSQLKEETELLARQNNQLTSEEEKWRLQTNELKVLSDERNKLLAEKDRWIQDQANLRALVLERDGLLAERGRAIFREQEMKDGLEERDRLKSQECIWRAREEEMRRVINGLEEDLARQRSQHNDNLDTEKDDLKRKLELCNVQHEQEVRALVRERDFVWSQMKLIEGSYEERIKQMARQIQRGKLEIERLRKSKQDVEAGHNEAKVEMTILKLEAKQAEDLAIQKQKAVEADVKELYERLEKIRNENKSLVGVALKKQLEMNTQNESLQNQRDSASYQTHEAGPADGAAKEVPEVLNAEESLALDFRKDLMSGMDTLVLADQDHKMLESQTVRAPEADNNHDKLKKQVGDLQRENDTLRRDSENLKSLYAELEETLHKTRQKPGKGTRRANYRDPTSRNLKLELEAVAAGCCPSTENSMSNGMSYKLNKRKTGVKSTQKRIRGASDPVREGGERPGNQDLSPRQTRSSRKNLTGKPYPEEVDAVVLSPKSSGLRDPTDAVQSLISALDDDHERSDAQPLQKRRRSFGKENEEKGQHGSFLRALPPKGRPKQAVRTPLAPKSASRDLGAKTTFTSPTKSSKMMANLFSNSFSVPKLKPAQTPMGVKS